MDSSMPVGRAAATAFLLIFSASLTVGLVAAGDGQTKPLRGVIEPRTDLVADGGFAVPRSPPLWLHWKDGTAPAIEDASAVAVRVQQWRWQSPAPARPDATVVNPAATREETETLVLRPTIRFATTPATSWTVRSGPLASSVDAEDARSCRLRPELARLEPDAGLATTLRGLAAPVLDVRCNAGTLRLALNEGDIEIRVHGSVVEVMGLSADDLRPVRVLSTAGTFASRNTTLGGAVYDNVMRVVVLIPRVEAHQPLRFESENATDVRLRTPMMEWSGELRVPAFRGRLEWGGEIFANRASSMGFRGAFFAFAQGGGPMAPSVELLGLAEPASEPIPAPGSPLDSGTMVLLGLSLLAFVGALVLFTRITRHHVLDHAIRRALVDVVEARPGIQPSTASAVLSVHRTTLIHHLDILERNGILIVRRDGRRVHLFRPGHGTADPRKDNLLRRPVVQRLLRAVARRPAVTQAAIAAELDISQQAVSKLVRRLEEVDALRRTRSAHGTAYRVVVGE